MKRIGIFLMTLLFTITSFAQIGIGTTNPNSKAVLDLSSTDKGLLVPRMTAVQRIAINPAGPARGLMIFDTDSVAFMFWTGSVWQRLGASNNAAPTNSWSVNGNTLTGVEKFGSLNNYPLEFLVNNKGALRLEYATSGSLAIPNIIGGNVGNSVVGGFGNTIAGGGYSPTVFNGIDNGNLNFIGSGNDNLILDHSEGVIVSGNGNSIRTVDGVYRSFIGTGFRNGIKAGYGFIGNGELDTVLATRGAILNGISNKAIGGTYGTILNGQNNLTSGVSALVGNGNNNRAENGFTTILNGGDNVINGQYGIVGTGTGHKITSRYGVLLNGVNNKLDFANGNYATIINGTGNVANGTKAFIASGDTNTINENANFAFIGNGSQHVITNNGDYSFIGNGINNQVSGLYGVIVGGNTNEATNDFTAVLGGGGNTAGGEAATVLGGRFNQAMGSYSVASGFKSDIIHGSNFMYADYRATGANFMSKNTGQFMVRVQNGALFSDEDTSTAVLAQLHVRSEGSTAQLMADQVADDFARIRLRSGNALINHWDIAAKASDAEFNIFRNGTGNVLKLTPTNATNLMSLSNGARLTAGGTWTNSSDKDVKDNITPVNGDEILEKLAAMPVATWHYKNEADSILHIGPMAQDFKAAFGLGDSDKSIATVDADGVNMAAIQAMYLQVQQLTQRVKELEAILDAPHTKKRTKR